MHHHSSEPWQDLGTWLPEKPSDFLAHKWSRLGSVTLRAQDYLILDDSVVHEITFHLHFPHHNMIELFRELWTFSQPTLSTGSGHGACALAGDPSPAQDGDVCLATQRTQSVLACGLDGLSLVYTG